MPTMPLSHKMKLFSNFLLEGRFREIYNMFWVYPLWWNKKTASFLLNKFFPKLGIDLFPPFLEVEPTTICNLRCVCCEHTYWKESAKNMSFEQFKKVFDDFGRPKWLGLTGIGSSYLNKDYHKMLAYAKSKGTIVEIFDHFAHFKDDSKIKELIEIGPDFQFVSTYGASKKSFEKVCVGSDYELIEKNIKRFVELKKQMKKRFPILNFHYIITSESKDEILDFLDFVNLSSFKNPNNNLEAYVAWWIGILKGDGIPRENLKINGIDMILVKFSSDKWPAMSGHPDCLGSDWWFFEKNGYIYRFMYLPGDRCIKPDDASKRDEAQKTMEAMVKTFQFKETTKVAPKVTVIEFNQLRVMVELAYDENRVFPDSLSQLKDIGSFKRENLQYVLYSASPDKQHYHMGIDLGDINFSDLAKDSDYNSKAQGWINGLDGKDPVYDSYSQ